MAPSLAECAREPIAFPGKIQPHGVLLAIGMAERRICSVSENVGLVLGRDADALLGEQVTALGLGTLDLAEAGLYRMGPFEALVHHHNPHILLELRAPTEAPSTAQSAFASGYLTRAYRDIHAASGELAAIETALTHVAKLTGYARTLAYRFDADWHGEVVAEQAAPGLVRYQDLHFPASDIPEQARALYEVHWVRSIPDVSYQPVELRSLPTLSPSTLDLGPALLRSVSPIHIQYLKNMGVAASLSISVHRNGVLWGLISCHHTSPRVLDFDVLERCSLLGRFLSEKIESEQNRQRESGRARVRSSVAVLHAELSAAGAVADSLVREEHALLDLVQATGAAVLHRGQLHRLGQTPEPAQLHSLFEWFSAQRCELISEHALPLRYPAARDFAGVATGVLGFSLPDTQPAFLLWFRPEVLRVVTWGGDPNKPVESADAQALSPRHSFEQWQETVRWTSLNWTEMDREAASELRRAMIEADLVFQLHSEQQMRSALEQSNGELDAYAYVIAHDLLAPTRGIVSFGELLERELAQGQQDLARQRASMMRRSAQRLAEVVRSLHEYSKVGRLELALTETSLARVVQEQIERLAPYLIEQKARVSVSGHLPTLRCDRVRVGEIFANLIQNAVKHNPQVCVSIRCQTTDCPTIYVADDGVGIPEAARSHVFNMFWRGSSTSEASSGMGLAIVHRIVERHGGRIWIEDTPGGGATFAFTLCPPHAQEHCA